MVHPNLRASHSSLSYVFSNDSRGNHSLFIGDFFREKHSRKKLNLFQLIRRIATLKANSIFSAFHDILRYFSSVMPGRGRIDFATPRPGGP